jgi:hypothetical protein
MIREIPAFAVSALVTLALPLTALAQNATDSPAVVSTGVSAPAKRAPSPSTFGTAHTSYIEVPANAFQPWNSTQTYTSDNSGAGPRWCTSTLHELLAPLHLPSGAKIVYLELDYHDTSATNATYGSLITCDYHAENCTFHPAAGEGTGDCLIAGFLCSGLAATGTSNVHVNLTPEDLTVDNYTMSYSLMATPGASDGSEKVDGMIVGYVLQVSPAPGTATFWDVPVGHQQFRFVEALSAAGITAGCGGGAYCPNVAVTRGQMAVFLSVALGLQFQ